MSKLNANLNSKYLRAFVFWGALLLHILETHATITSGLYTISYHPVGGCKGKFLSYDYRNKVYLRAAGTMWPKIWRLQAVEGRFNEFMISAVNHSSIAPVRLSYSTNAAGKVVLTLSRTQNTKWTILETSNDMLALVTPRDTAGMVLGPDMPTSNSSCPTDTCTLHNRTGMTKKMIWYFRPWFVYPVDLYGDRTKYLKQGYISGDNTPGDGFGSQVAVYKNLVAVRQYDAVYAIVRKSPRWERTKLTLKNYAPANIAASKGFIAVTGSACKPEEIYFSSEINVCSKQPTLVPAVAYVFDQSKSWKMTALSTGVKSNYPARIAASETNIVIGVPQIPSQETFEDFPFSSTGIACVFDRQANGSWSGAIELPIPEEFRSGNYTPYEFGNLVASFGNRVAVSIRLATDKQAVPWDPGAVLFYVKDTSTNEWSYESSIKAKSQIHSMALSGDNSGDYVALYNTDGVSLYHRTKKKGWDKHHVFDIAGDLYATKIAMTRTSPAPRGGLVLVVAESYRTKSRIWVYYQSLEVSSGPKLSFKWKQSDRCVINPPFPSDIAVGQTQFGGYNNYDGGDGFGASVALHEGKAVIGAQGAGGVFGDAYVYSISNC